jgi:hypothetical protein
MFLFGGEQWLESHGYFHEGAPRLRGREIGVE